MKNFLSDWKNYGFKVAVNNWHVLSIKAKRIRITYGKDGVHSK